MMQSPSVHALSIPACMRTGGCSPMLAAQVVAWLCPSSTLQTDQHVDSTMAAGPAEAAHQGAHTTAHIASDTLAVSSCSPNTDPSAAARVCEEDQAGTVISDAQQPVAGPEKDPSSIPTAQSIGGSTAGSTADSTSTHTAHVQDAQAASNAPGTCTADNTLAARSTPECSEAAQHHDQNSAGNGAGLLTESLLELPQSSSSALAAAEMSEGPAAGATAPATISQLPESASPAQRPPGCSIPPSPAGTALNQTVPLLPAAETAAAAATQFSTIRSSISSTAGQHTPKQPSSRAQQRAAQPSRMAANHPNGHSHAAVSRGTTNSTQGSLLSGAGSRHSPAAKAAAGRHNVSSSSPMSNCAQQAAAGNPSSRHSAAVAKAGGPNASAAAAAAPSRGGGGGASCRNTSTNAATSSITATSLSHQQSTAARRAASAGSSTGPVSAGPTPTAPTNAARSAQQRTAASAGRRSTTAPSPASVKPARDAATPTATKPGSRSSTRSNAVSVPSSPAPTPAHDAAVHPPFTNPSTVASLMQLADCWQCGKLHDMLLKALRKGPSFCAGLRPPAPADPALSQVPQVRGSGGWLAIQQCQQAINWIKLDHGLGASLDLERWSGVGQGVHVMHTVQFAGLLPVV